MPIVVTFDVGRGYGGSEHPANSSITEFTRTGPNIVSIMGEVTAQVSRGGSAGPCVIHQVVFFATVSGPYDRYKGVVTVQGQAQMEGFVWPPFGWDGRGLSWGFYDKELAQVEHGRVTVDNIPPPVPLVWPSYSFPIAMRNNVRTRVCGCSIVGGFTISNARGRREARVHVALMQEVLFQFMYGARGDQWESIPADMEVRLEEGETRAVPLEDLEFVPGVPRHLDYDFTPRRGDKASSREQDKLWRLVALLLKDPEVRAKLLEAEGKARRRKRQRKDSGAP